jgi:hypothetical protein
LLDSNDTFEPLSLLTLEGLKMELSLSHNTSLIPNEADISILLWRPFLGPSKLNTCDWLV